VGRRQRYAGGKGIDVSRAIHEMGGVSIAYGFIGGDNGRAVEILLDEEGVLFSRKHVRILLLRIPKLASRRELVPPGLAFQKMSWSGS